MGFGWQELLVILVIVVIIFGGSKLAGVGKASGKAIREFKDELKGPDAPASGQPPVAEPTGTYPPQQYAPQQPYPPQQPYQPLAPAPQAPAQGYPPAQGYAPAQADPYNATPSGSAAPAPMYPDTPPANPADPR